MKDGYYWARDYRTMDYRDNMWEKVMVSRYEGKQRVTRFTDMQLGYIEDYEFGDRIEIPEKYK